MDNSRATSPPFETSARGGAIEGSTDVIGGATEGSTGVGGGTTKGSTMLVIKAKGAIVEAVLLTRFLQNAVSSASCSSRIILSQ